MKIQSIEYVKAQPDEFMKAQTSKYMRTQTDENIKKQTDEFLIKNLHQLVGSERKITRQVLELIHEANKRKIYAARGYPNSLDWLVKEFGYSHSAAYRRLQSARLLESNPEVAAKFEDGTINLSTATLLQKTIRNVELNAGKLLEPSDKMVLIEKIENRSTRETEQILAEQFPAEVKNMEMVRQVSGELTKISLHLNRQQVQKLQRTREIASHKNQNLAEVIEMVCDDYLKRKDPLLKPQVARCAADAAVQSVKIQKSLSRYIPAAIRTAVFQRDRGKCTYRDPQTGKLCGGTFNVQIDHIRPYVMNGKHELENLRCLCRTHNLYRSQKDAIARTRLI